RSGRRMPDGSVDVYAQPDGLYGVRRKVLLTESRDAQGNAIRLSYDEQFRRVAVSDATGLVTMLSYGLAADPLKITKVTDPFGRYATLTYDSQGRLASITDAIALRSSFTYDDTDLVTAMT